MPPWDDALLSGEYIQGKIGKIQAGTVGLVLGSGLGGALAAFKPTASLPYASIPGFPRAGVPGHAGRLLAGKMSGRPLLVLAGRFHLYEGHSAAQVCAGVRALAALGLRTLILTNTAGSLNPLFPAGRLMCLADHINLSGHNPLAGPLDPALGDPFLDMGRAYDPGLRELALEQAARLGLRLEQGVYLQVPGPSLETPAETRAFRALGADAIGMSTAVETIAARRAGMRVLALSCLTNQNLPDCQGPVSHARVLAAAKAAAADLGRLLAGIIKELPETSDEKRAPGARRGRRSRA